MLCLHLPVTAILAPGFECFRKRLSSSSCTTLSSFSSSWCLCFVVNIRSTKVSRKSPLSLGLQSSSFIQSGPDMQKDLSCRDRLVSRWITFNPVGRNDKEIHNFYFSLWFTKILDPCTLFFKSRNGRQVVMDVSSKEDLSNFHLSLLYTFGTKEIFSIL